MIEIWGSDSILKWFPPVEHNLNFEGSCRLDTKRPVAISRDSHHFCNGQLAIVGNQYEAKLYHLAPLSSESDVTLRYYLEITNVLGKSGTKWFTTFGASQESMSEYEKFVTCYFPEEAVLLQRKHFHVETAPHFDIWTIHRGSTIDTRFQFYPEEDNRNIVDTRNFSLNSVSGSVIEM